jgi:hypothetical protein
MLLSTIFFTLGSGALAIPYSFSVNRASLPFTKIAAFGDELSDNGNSSYAHGITGNPATVYGYGI